MGLFEPFKQLLSLVNLCFVIYSLLFTTFVFYNDYETEYCPASISNNKETCGLIMTLANNNKFVYNVLLMGSFYAAHTGMITVNQKFGFATTFGSFWYDETFAFLSGLHYYVCMTKWAPMNDPVFIAAENGAFVATLFYCLQFIGLAMVGYSPLFLKYWCGNNPGKMCDVNIFQFVRHPTYLGFFLVMLFRPEITVGTLFFAACQGTYALVATFYNEEPRMVQIFGQAYEDYKTRVPALVPFSFGFGKAKQN